MRSLSREESRAVDLRAVEEYAIPSLILMENAGRSAALLLEMQHIRGRIVICCGKGNNAGDGFVMARHLDAHRFEVRILLANRPESLTGDAAIQFEIVRRANIPIREMHGSPREEWLEEMHRGHWIVDALLGTGMVGPVREPMATPIEAMNACGRKIFAVDTPSGFDCDTGQPKDPTVRATITGTFVSRKLGFDVPGSEFWTGRVHVLEIGLSGKFLKELGQLPNGA